MLVYISGTEKCAKVFLVNHVQIGTANYPLLGVSESGGICGGTGRCGMGHSYIGGLLPAMSCYHYWPTEETIPVFPNSLT